ncbi:MAG: exopolyphosphatase [Woeseiaceae bacterium]|nr:exopolyphosphatase [Woeseiaceae bacterium]
MPAVIAAVDLGSNSFHMIVGELRHGQLAIIDRIRETVRLAEGLSSKGDLSDAARDRALHCLARFGQRLRDVHADNVRAAGTSTIRRAREDSSFMAEAEAALGHPIEVISGIEEARLIYTGVTHSLPANDGFRLVMDIGGGSTELILGEGTRPRALESLHLGCVSLTERFFGDGVLSRKAFDKARLRARLELRPIKAFFRGAEDVEAIGTSGTINSAAAVALELGIIESGDLTLAAVEELIERMLAFDRIMNIELRGLSERRAQVWPGGLSILAELMQVLRVDHLKVSDGALREGLLYDLLGRMRHEDARERTVRAMAARYQVDRPQAERVAATAQALIDQVGTTWFTNPEWAAQMLGWAATLHEIGLDISHDGYQRHGAYVAEHADMPGFPRAEQRLLAFLIGSQRYGIDGRLQRQLPNTWREGAVRLAILLRLAVLLNRARSSKAVPLLQADARNSMLSLAFDPAWLAENPLTIADIQREQSRLNDVGYELQAS